MDDRMVRPVATLSARLVTWRHIDLARVNSALCRRSAEPAEPALFPAVPVTSDSLVLPSGPSRPAMDCRTFGRHPAMTHTPLTILDLVPISSGSDAAQALRNSIELAQYAEDLGYARYWFAEHHLSPGVAGTSPAVVIALIAASTHRIRLGAGAVQLGHRTALATVEEFGLLDALYPGRIDLGPGRSGGKGKPAPPVLRAPRPPRREASVTPEGLLLPPAFDHSALLASPRFGLIKALLLQPGAEAQDYTEQIGDILALLRGTYATADGVEAHVIPGGASRGSSRGSLARCAAGERAHRSQAPTGCASAANYHVSPTSVVEAVDGYRAAFKPASDTYGVSVPHVSVSADVVVAEDEDTSARAGRGLWPVGAQHSHRRGRHPVSDSG